ncbi:MAG: STAS domain-containing protein [Vogesella sp.]|jgi:anti-anti-sigma factor|uniref:STAS domain-containing protein n=1 Tax=Vogesella sp. TaxID=1904252 RepID=UPI0014792CAB
MSVTFHIREQEATIQVHGHFNFSQHGAFRDACKAVLAHQGVKSVEINLMEVDHLDSSALGMLLVLRDQVEERRIQRLLISNAKPVVRQIFAIAKFDKFFEID